VVTLNRCRFRAYRAGGGINFPLLLHISTNSLPKMDGLTVKKMQKKIFSAGYEPWGRFIHIRWFKRCNQLSTIPVDNLVY